VGKSGIASSVRGLRTPVSSHARCRVRTRCTGSGSSGSLGALSKRSKVLDTQRQPLGEHIKESFEERHADQRISTKRRRETSGNFLSLSARGSLSLLQPRPACCMGARPR
jgi:hypothetical protein